jgi:hypothetical protein
MDIRGADPEMMVFYVILNDKDIFYIEAVNGRLHPDYYC